MQAPLPHQPVTPPRPRQPVARPTSVDRDREPADVAADDGMEAHADNSDMKSQGFVGDFGPIVQKPSVDWDWDPQAAKESRNR